MSVSIGLRMSVLKLQNLISCIEIMHELNFFEKSAYFGNPKKVAVLISQTTLRDQKLLKYTIGI